MSEIQTFSNSVKGTYSQIKLTNGEKIFVSLTKQEITVTKIKFGRIPVGTIYKQDLACFAEGLDDITPLDSTPLLDLIVQYLLCANNISEVLNFLNNVRPSKA